MKLAAVPRLRGFLLSCLCAFTGGHMVNYAVIMYAQEVLRSDLLAGVGFGLCFGPPLLLGFIAGVQCDRRSPVLLIQGAQAMFICAALGLLAGELIGGGARIPLVLAAAFCAGLGWSFAAPARMTTLGRLVPPEGLKKAAMVFNLLIMLGFGAGPLLIAAMRQLGGWPAVFVLAAALFAAGSLLLLGLSTPANGGSGRTVAAELAEGWRAVRADPLVAQLLVCSVFCFMMMGPMQILLPRLARSALGLSEIGRGAFLGMLAPALIVGGILCLALAARIPNGRSILFASGAGGLLFAVLSTTTTVGLAVPLLVATGLCGGVAVSLIVAGLQARVPDAVRGRVMSMYTVISQAGPALSGLAAGALAQGVGAAQAALLCGVLLVGAALVNAAWMGAVRRY